MRRLSPSVAACIAACVTVAACALVGVPSAHAATPIDDRVGALWFPSALGLGPALGTPHICSASVVHSAGHDLIATAAHCIYGSGAAYEFVPGYAKGVAPDGVWTVTAAYFDPAWKKSNDPHDDLALLRVAPQRRAGHTVNIEDVTGAFTLGTAPTPGTSVAVSGYKLGSNDLPLNCTGTTTLTNSYPTVPCTDFVAGTSGGPWTSGSTLVGVIGGLNEGGCTPEINYSAPFGAAAAALLVRAEAGGHGDSVLPPLSDGC